MVRLTGTFVVLICVTVFGFTASAVALQPTPAKSLVVGTKEAPPFSMKSADGRWTGISIELWRSIARDLDIPFKFQETDLKGLLEGVEKGTLDVSVAALTITPEREKAVDFTHPFHTTGLGIAIKSKGRNPWISVAERLFSTAFLKGVGVLVLLLFVVGALVWWFERRRNPKQFGGGLAQGLTSAFWWSAVTMTTVGYGDKAPVTVGGRAVALVWMFAGIIMISGLTATIAASLTVISLESPIRGPADLPKVRVGAISNTTSDSYLKERRIFFERFKTPADGFAALATGKVQAFVYDAPILRYLVKHHHQGAIHVLPSTFERQDYGIALPQGSPLREPINLLLLEKIKQPAWQDSLNQYLGI
jgi:ABC-type amino acid transport substrate-binding protein